MNQGLLFFYFTCLLLLGLHDLGLLPEPGAESILLPIDTVHNCLLVLKWGGTKCLVLFLQLRWAKKGMRRLDHGKNGFETTSSLHQQRQLAGFLFIVEMSSKGWIWPCRRHAASFKVCWWQARVFASAAAGHSFGRFISFILIITILCCPGFEVQPRLFLATTHWADLQRGHPCFF